MPWFSDASPHVSVIVRVDVEEVSDDTRVEN